MPENKLSGGHAVNTRITLLLTSLASIAIFAGLIGCGCGGGSGQPGEDAALDAGIDGGTGDSGVPDSGMDGGLPTDGGNPDGGVTDSGVDSGTDSGITDTGSDSGADAAVTDSGTDSGTDAGVDGGGDGGPAFCLTSQCCAVPPTGQTKCYNNGDADGGGVITCPSNRSDPFWGQDPQFPKARTLTCSGGACSTTAAADGEVVTDSLSGLVWQRTFVSDKNWLAGRDYCDTLDYGGYVDWRLPNLFEMASMVDNNKFNPAVDIQIFPGTALDYNYFWSSSLYAGDASVAWYMGFDGGFVENVSKTNADFIRCVSSGTVSFSGGARFVVTEPVSGQQVVTDAITGLMWQGNLLTVREWQQALNDCALLNHGGFADWRLPNKNELLSLANYSRHTPASDFPGMASDYFWSSSTAAYYTDGSWIVNFDSGRLTVGYKALDFNARCVRGGP